eukprot:425815-Prymnesium_polylepis.1
MLLAGQSSELVRMRGAPGRAPRTGCRKPYCMGREAAWVESAPESAVTSSLRVMLVLRVPTVLWYCVHDRCVATRVGRRAVAALGLARRERAQLAATSFFLYPVSSKLYSEDPVLLFKRQGATLR